MKITKRLFKVKGKEVTLAYGAGDRYGYVTPIDGSPQFGVYGYPNFTEIGRVIFEQVVVQVDYKEGYNET